MATPEPLDELGPTTTADPLIGAELGEYRVLSLLGQGSMGVVYRGEQPLIGKPVAIKVLQKALSADPVYVQKLLEEARAISAARHPNIIDIFSFGEAPTGQQYFVMECLDGDPLDVHLRDQGRLSVEEAIRLLEQIMAGLSAAHAAGVVHRDLKPSNIFLARLGDGTRFVKLLDFGLAKRTAPHSGVRTTANLIVGTALYMAPEQASSEEVGPWTDLYAVGCIAHELLTGAPPFPGENIIEVLGLHAQTAPMPLRQLDPSIPEALEALVLELLEKVPSKRPVSAAAVRKTLERIERKLTPRETGLHVVGGRPPAVRATDRVPAAESTNPFAVEPTHLSLPKTQQDLAAVGTVRDVEPIVPPTQPAQPSLAAAGVPRLWLMLLLLAPLLGVGGFLIAKQLDTPPPVIPITDLTLPEPELSEAVAVPPPLPPVPPVAPPTQPPVAVEPPPVRAPVPVKPKRPLPVRGGHTFKDVEERLHDLQRRVNDEPVADRAMRAQALRDLKSIQEDVTAGRVPPARLWKELAEIEQRAYPPK